MQLILSLEADSTLPLYKQMANAICKAVHDGALHQGQALPSSRELAECMSVSRLTARRCYEELLGQGYIKTQSRGKTYINRALPVSMASVPDTSRNKRIDLSELGRRLSDGRAPLSGLEASMTAFGATPEEHLPISRWQECLYEAVRDAGNTKPSYERDSFGLLKLREQLQALIARTRGIKCSPEQIIVFPSTAGGFDLLSRLTLNDGDMVAMEDPGFVGIRNSLRLSEANICPIPLDSEGIRMDVLADLEEAPRLIVVTPSRQDTTGIIMSSSRRHRLLQWVVSSESIIVENDCDGDFRYGQEPQPALFSQDISGSVIYRYNFWKSLYPLLKMSFMVIPRSLVASFRGALNSVHPDMPQLEQIALASFIRKGHYERHLHRCRKAYASKRASMIHAFTKFAGYSICLGQQTGGTNLIAQFSASLSDDAIVCAAERSGISICSTRANYSKFLAPPNEYLISFSDIKETEIDARVSEFVRLLQVPVFNINTNITSSLHLSSVKKCLVVDMDPSQA